LIEFSQSCHLPAALSGIVVQFLNYYSIKSAGLVALHGEPWWA